MASNLTKKFEEVIQASERFNNEWSNTHGSFYGPKRKRDKEILLMRFEGLKEAVAELGEALEDLEEPQE